MKKEQKKDSVKTEKKRKLLPVFGCEIQNVSDSKIDELNLLDVGILKNGNIRIKSLLSKESYESYIQETRINLFSGNTELNTYCYLNVISDPHLFQHKQLSSYLNLYYKKTGDFNITTTRLNLFLDPLQMQSTIRTSDGKLGVNVSDNGIGNIQSLSIILAALYPQVTMQVYIF